MFDMQVARMEEHGAKSVWIAKPEYQQQYSLAQGMPPGLLPPPALLTANGKLVLAVDLWDQLFPGGGLHSCRFRGNQAGRILCWREKNTVKLR
jgi:hypothetical protein